MKTFSAFLGLGSNLGERHKYLRRACDELKKEQDIRVLWGSAIYETDPVGGVDQPKFLNAVVEIETTLEPAAMLAVVKGIESRLGRIATEKWGPRIIDIDILIYDGLVCKLDTITVPHTELENRKFALIPLREIAPDLVHPISGMTISELVQSCKDSSRVVKTSYGLLI